MNFIQQAQLVLSLLPAIIGVVRAIEEAIPGEGRGEQKLAMVRNVLEQVYALTSGSTKPAFDQVWGALSAAISGVVDTLNKIGAFKK